jgi:hypothetical protein
MGDLIFGFLLGGVIGLFVGAAIAIDNDAFEAKKRCEAELPRNQECRMVFVPDAPK